jgi:hypothetical protein
MRRFVHDFLKWFPVAIGGGALATAGVWTEAKDWIAAKVVWGWSQMSNPWIALLLLVSVAAYVAAIIWTGSDRKPAHRPSVIVWFVEKIRKIFHKEFQAETRPVGSLGIEVKRAKPAETWMPLHAALRYLVYESEWGHEQARPASRDDLDRLVSLEIRERLARGELHARGAKGGGFSNPDRPTEVIPADYWIHGFIQPHGEIVMADPNRAAAGNPTGNDTYRRVIISSADLASIWPRSSTTGLSALASFVEPDRKEYEASEAASRAKVGEPTALPATGLSKAEILARRIREHPDTAQFDYPTLKCILRAEIPHPTGQRIAQAGSPPHSTEVMMLVSSIHNRPIPGCWVILQSIAEAGGPTETVMLPFTWGSNTFDAQPHMPHSFYMLQRNLSDPINPDPFVIKIADTLRPLRENTEYKLVLELRAPPYPFPTIVELVIRTGFGLDVECEIISQHLPEIADA